ncbi:ribonuclease H-like domain-containing protein [Tanacetum coccineum]
MYVHGYTDDEFEPGDQPTLISRLDVSDPLDFHPNDSAALTVTSVKLKGTESYQVWSCDMLLALEGKNKTGFNDGTCKRLNALWKKFDALVQLPRCTCHAADDFKKYNQLMKFKQFLMGLDDSYMQIRSNIFIIEPLPDVRNAYAINSSEESHRVVSSSSSGTSQRSQSFMFNYNMGNRNSVQRPQTSGTSIRHANVTRTSNTGNRRPNGGRFVNNNYVGFGSGSASTSSFSDEHFSKLISLIKENSGNFVGKGVHANMTVGMIVDSGANQHLTYTDKYLVNVIDISELKIKVLHHNGTEALITKVGNIKLIEHLTLYDVLVVPKYCGSLMSFYKVAKDNKFVIAFDEPHCYVFALGFEGNESSGISKQKGWFILF